MLAPDGSPVSHRWAVVAAGPLRVWALGDDTGECLFRDLPLGPYRLSADADDHLALTTAIASGRSPATTPVGP